MKRKANAVWTGTGKEGKGTLSTQSNVLDKTAYSFKARFEDEEGKSGTNPEELIAAAHAGCFTMALSFQIEEAGYSSDELNTEAQATIKPVDGGGFEISEIKLSLDGKVDGMSEEEFKELAEGAKANCPVSKALSSVPIKLDIKFG